MSNYDQTKGELCDKCGWAMKFPGEPCRCELERENAALRSERDELLAWKTGKKGIEEYYEMVSQRDAARAELDATRKLLDTHILRSDLFSYLAWLEDNREHDPDVTGADYLVLASDNTTCWGKTFTEAVQVAEQHDRALFDAALAQGGAK